MEMIDVPVAPVVVWGSPPVISKAVGTRKVASPLGSAPASEPGKKVHPAKKIVKTIQQTLSQFLFAVIIVLLFSLGYWLKKARKPSVTNLLGIRQVQSGTPFYRPLPDKIIFMTNFKQNNRAF
jgi:hypothetical protein